MLTQKCYRLLYNDFVEWKFIEFTSSLLGGLSGFSNIREHSLEAKTQGLFEYLLGQQM